MKNPKQTNKLNKITMIPKSKVDTIKLIDSNKRFTCQYV